MPPSITRFFQSLAPMFRPPFEGLWILTVLYYGWCFAVYPHSQILRGNLPDPDDYMYLTQTLDWLQGQGWYDNIQHRLNPPDGVPIHFSRFAQMPMAALILLFKTLGLGPKGAALITAVFYPLILLSGLLLAMRWLMKSFVPSGWTGVSTYVTLFATGMMFMFTPGHVDHHGLVILITVLALGFVLRMFEKPTEPCWGLLAGLTLAFGLTIALEILPWLLVITACLGIWAVAKGGKAAINALGFGLALYLGSVVFLALTRRPAEWFTPDVLTYSIVYTLLTAGIAVGFAGAAATANAPASIRWVIGTSLATLMGFLFLHHFPALVAGPYGGMDPELARLMLDEIDEAKPLIKSEDSWLAMAVHVGGVGIALPATICFFRQAKNEVRWCWGLILILLVTAFTLTFFYEYRFIGVLGMLTIIPLTTLLQRGWEKISLFPEGRRKVWAEIGLLLLVGPLPSVLFPALVDGRSFSTGILLFPVDSSVVRAPCDTVALERILQDPSLYGDHQHLIVSTMGQGPELLFRTHHQVLSAPFHMDVTGNIDATRFFSTPYPSEAESIIRRRHIDLVVACRYVPDFYTRPPDAKPGTSTGGAGKDFAPHLIERLMTNKAPEWLKKATFREMSNFVIYEVALPPDSTLEPAKGK